MVLMRELASVCPGHVREGRPTLQTLIIESTGSGPYGVQVGRLTSQILILEPAKPSPG